MLYHEYHLRLSSQFDQWERMVSDLDASFLQKRHLPEKWSIQEHMAHLGRYHEVFFDRIEAILSEEEPQFSRYVAEEDPEFQQWQGLELPELKAENERLRSHLYQRLMALDQRDWFLKGVHPKFGKMALTEWTDFFLFHEAHHLYQMFRLKMEFRELKAW